MLQNFTTFLVRDAVKSYMYLLNPRIVDQNNVELPKSSVLHYLDIKSNNHFPVRDIYYLNKIDKSKKIPIYNINDLLYKDEVSTLINKTINQEIRKWNQSNIKQFKAVNLLETNITDINIIPIYNYNLLKDMYKYKTSMLSSYFKYRNIYLTYFDYIKKAIDHNKENYHFIPIDIPTAIPSYNIINILLKFNAIKYSRVVTDINLYNILEIYKWLIDKHRKNSNLKNITDEDSNRIIIEFKYKGYSSFIPLYVLRSISDESKLESKIKISPIKLEKLFILYLYKLQDIVNEIIENSEKLLKEEVENNNDDDLSNKIKHEDDEDIDENLGISNDNDDIDSFPNKEKEIYGINNIKINNKDNDNNIFNVTNIDENISEFNRNIDNEIERLANNNIDEVFEETIYDIENENIDTNIDNNNILNVNKNIEYINNILKDESIDDKVSSYLEKSSKFKTLTNTQINNIKSLYNKRLKMKSPYDKDKLLNDHIQINKEEVKLVNEELRINDNNTLVDDNLKKEVILNMDNKYINNIIRKDILACVTDLEKSGIIIENYEIEEQNSVLGRYEVHSIKLKPLEGNSSTIYMRLPKIDSEGEFYASGVKCRLRKQRSDLPIRKISPTKVALTSSYGKLFIYRTDRKVFDDFSYIEDYIKTSYIEQTNNILKIKPGNFYNNTEDKPNVFSRLSMSFEQIETDKYTLVFSNKEKENLLNKETIDNLDTRNLTFIGYDSNSNILVIDNNDIIYNYGKNMEKIGDIVDLLGMDRSKIPSSFTMINILGSDIPLGIVLMYYIGISNLISILNADYEIIESNKRYEKKNDELLYKFKDYKLIIRTKKKEDSLLFNGLIYFKDKIKEYNLKDFDYKEVYLNIIEHRNLSLIHLKELDLIRDLFLDSITKNVLELMNEPTDFIPLLLRANELLKNFSHPDINDPNYSRIRGYDRIPSLMYKALTESIREYKFKNQNLKTKIELDPYKVWNYITRDNTMKLSEDNNPITDLKEIESVTLTGLDGLNKDATPVLLRRFHPNDTGLISEATVDSGDVALNTYLTPYAKFSNVRGMINNDSKEVDENPSKIFSTSVLLSPGSDQDDPKRLNFINIQNGHTIPAYGYTQPLLRTGYEYIIPYKTGKLYCYTAKDDGIVIDKTDKLITIKYNNGKTESIRINKIYGRMEGHQYSHNIVTKLNVNDKFKKNDYICYNTNFFEEDWLDKSKLVLKFNKTITVALSMTNEVFEDSSAISAELSKEMTTDTIEEKSFIIDFNKNIMNLPEIGTEINPDDHLFVLLDENTDFNNLSDSSIEMLKSLASFAPKAKVKGIIDRYEVRYNGELQDMSNSLRKLVNKLDKQAFDESKGTEYEIFNYKVNSEYRVNGKNLDIDTLELKIFIREPISMAIGDKGVFANQMKSVISDVYNEKIVTESGTVVDAVFSYKGILNRVVNSPILIGTTNRILKFMSKKVSEIYFSK